MSLRQAIPVWLLAMGDGQNKRCKDKKLGMRTVVESMSRRTERVRIARISQLSQRLNRWHAFDRNVPINKSNPNTSYSHPSCP